MTTISPATPTPEPGLLASLNRRPARTPFLAAAMQNTLVPLITYDGARLEAHGQSVPKDHVGGDLVDFVADGRDVIAYVADVSGHGLHAGVLMGMIKTAMRYGLLLRQPLAKLLEDLNVVLQAVKEPNMFATLAALRFDASNHVEYISAGHVPLLHYRQRYGDVVLYSMPQFPLGLFPRAGYTGRRIPYESGDLFAIVTDGVVELGEDQDAETGLERLATILSELPGRPLSDIAAAIYTTIQRPIQEDDQTVLLLRAAAENHAIDDTNADTNAVPGQPDDVNPNSESLDARWRKLLDELAAELARD
jgi:sigma-B regulation protein RsbU (phosphoserine phosphatase)